jgi:hypothetical protein
VKQLRSAATLLWRECRIQRQSGRVIDSWSIYNAKNDR